MGIWISIHAPRTGSDRERLPVLVQAKISIHAPRTGSDRVRVRTFVFVADFNPRSPHGERQDAR